MLVFGGIAAETTGAAIGVGLGAGRFTTLAFAGGVGAAFRGVAFFAAFFATFLTGFLAGFRAAFFAAFLAGFRAAFLAVAFRVVAFFAAFFFVAFFAFFFAAFAIGSSFGRRGRAGPAETTGPEPAPSRIISTRRARGRTRSLKKNGGQRPAAA